MHVGGLAVMLKRLVMRNVVRGRRNQARRVCRATDSRRRSRRRDGRPESSLEPSPRHVILVEQIADVASRSS